MVCPKCYSPFTYIKRDSDSYGCLDCGGSGFRYVKNEDGMAVSNTSGRKILTANSDGELIPIDPGSGFGRVVGCRGQCPMCHCDSITAHDGFYQCNDPECGIKFGRVIDNEILFQHNVVFPLRSKNEFYKMTLYEIE